ncbi:hypothetical protein [Pseudomonas frederiksbergensis]|uniref:hypothetical protein n=1 Tax=Pseudomonas frederiksbergensis TaxID=104087 RepID=UPI00160976E3|nr:hypothetical protein [Pseudomonas frederiksbergensis]
MTTEYRLTLFISSKVTRSTSVGLSNGMILPGHSKFKFGEHITLIKYKTGEQRVLPERLVRQLKLAEDSR